jgi:hypothetical protein
LDWWPAIAGDEGINNRAALIFGLASAVVARSYGSVVRAVSENNSL